MQSRYGHDDIRLGVCLPLEKADSARWLAQLGFETLALYRKGSLEEFDWEEEIRVASGFAPVSAFSVYANPLASERDRAELEQVLRRVRRLGVSVVGCFTGALPEGSVTDQLGAFSRVWTELAAIAEGEGLRVAFENCAQGGSWERPVHNLAFCPAAWRLLFEAAPSPALGLQWEPAHAVCAFADPLAQVAEWAPRIWHIHAKDAHARKDMLAREGVMGRPHAVVHRIPGMGDTHWRHLIARLRELGWRGSLDIEGYHDQAHSGDLEVTGWVSALRHLREARGGDFVPWLKE